MGIKEMTGLDQDVKGAKHLLKGALTGLAFLYTPPGVYTAYDMYDDPSLKLRLTENQKEVDHFSNHINLLRCKALAVLTLPFINTRDDITSTNKTDEDVIKGYHKEYKNCISSILEQKRKEYDELHQVKTSL